MSESIFLKELFSILLIIIGLSLYINPDLYIKLYRDFFLEPIAVFMASLVGFSFGYYIISKHNIWEYSDNLIITILGWIMLIKSSISILIPRKIIKLVRKIKLKESLMKIIGIIYAIFGLILIF